jgi:hypothetical protein
MSDVNTFIDTVGHDVTDVVVPRVRDAVGELVTAVIQDLFQRYRPQLAGELHVKIMNGRLELSGHGIRLDVNRRDGGAPVASLDIPVSLQIKVDDLPVKLQNATARLDVVR